MTSAVNGVPVTVVSGLPRSGTSMMMRMLESGGMEVVTDRVRAADEDNPRGYYEIERVKKLPADSSWLFECRGMAVKIVSPLLRHIPAGLSCKVIMMGRTMEEILRSQRVMLERLGRSGPGKTDREMAEHFSNHLRKVDLWLNERRELEPLYIDFKDVIRDPFGNAERVSRFLGASLDVERMAGVVEKPLYRQRQENGEHD